ncbi:MAG: hypothetical protein AAGG51_01055 [Cyanobacteria bacterium P01_G01_bin.54]
MVKVLIVEDEPDMLEQHEKNLAERGIPCEGTKSSAKALMKVEQDQEIGLLIVDQVLLAGDEYQAPGSTVVRKANKLRCNMKSFFITSAASPDLTELPGVQAVIDKQEIEKDQDAVYDQIEDCWKHLNRFYKGHKPNFEAVVKLEGCHEDYQEETPLYVGQDYILQVEIQPKIHLVREDESPLDLKPKESLPVKVLISAQDMVIKPDWTQACYLKYSGESSSVNFILTPQKAGEIKDVDIDFYCHQDWVGVLTIEVEVKSKKAIQNGQI